METRFEPIITIVKHGKKTITITEIEMNEPSQGALARAAAKIALIKVK